MSTRAPYILSYLADASNPPIYLTLTIKKIVEEENFVPFDLAYGDAYIDELKRIRIVNKRIESEWISAEEKPEPFETVDLAILGKDGYFTTIGCFEHGAWTVYTGRLLSVEMVTHWKPRPLPPEVKS